VGAALALLGLVVFWAYQMWRVEAWLNSDKAPPADMYGIWGDMVARIHRHQREARDNQDRLQSMVDYLLESFTSMRDGVVIIEQQGTIRWCNAAATKLLNLRYPEDLGRTITNLVRYPEFAEYLSAEDYSGYLELGTEGDKPRQLEVTITRFAEVDRLMFVHDVTERSRLENMRRDFVANVSHELRTPLTVISGYLDTFLTNKDQLPTRQQKPLAQMAHQAKRMENLLRDLLWLSRIESEKREEKREQIDMEGLLSELREELRSTYPERRLEIDLKCGQRVVGDYRELYSAASNPVTNAIKYSDDESQVTVCWEESDGGPILSVRDQGIGIDAAHLPRLTERFYRVDDSRSSETGGTGLGLAIVKHVANGHGATLHVESTPGRGSVFRLKFPPQADIGELKRAG